MDKISEAVMKRKKEIFSIDDGFRKDVERAFGILRSRCHILASPCIFWDKRIMV